MDYRKSALRLEAITQPAPFMTTTIIAIVSQKGGVGKSTMARALAREAANNGLKVKIADLDTQQGTSVDWHRTRLNNGIEPAVSAEAYTTAAARYNSTSVSPDFDAKLRRMAERDHLLLVEVMEKALDLYEASSGRNQRLSNC
jgi:cellulose biosynthesis protein BcsQ